MKNDDLDGISYRFIFSPSNNDGSVRVQGQYTTVPLDLPYSLEYLLFEIPHFLLLGCTLMAVVK